MNNCEELTPFGFKVVWSEVSDELLARPLGTLPGLIGAHKARQW